MNPDTPDQVREFWALASQYPYMVYVPDKDQWVGHTDVLAAVDHDLLEQAWVQPEEHIK